MSKRITLWLTLCLINLLAPVNAWLTSATTARPLAFKQCASKTLDSLSKPSTALFSKKKGSASPASAKKIQVKLLKHVAGTGQAGEVVKVTPAFFNNRLRPTSLAKLISEEELEQEQTANAVARLEQDRVAQTMKDRIEALSFCLKRKVGPNGQLFGGVGPKVIMDELYDAIPDDFLTQKTVKIATLTDEHGKKIQGDIKSVGLFKASITLTSDYSATLDLKIEAE